MKKLIVYIMLLPLRPPAGAGSVPSDYDSATCTDLSVRIERRDSLTQYDYACIIAQNRAILGVPRGACRRHRRAARQPALHGLARAAGRAGIPGRFGYMFTLGSALYNADVDGLLDDDNSRAPTPSSTPSTTAWPLWPTASELSRVKYERPHPGKGCGL